MDNQNLNVTRPMDKWNKKKFFALVAVFLSKVSACKKVCIQQGRILTAAGRQLEDGLCQESHIAVRFSIGSLKKKVCLRTCKLVED